MFLRYWIRNADGPDFNEKCKLSEKSVSQSASLRDVDVFQRLVPKRGDAGFQEKLQIVGKTGERKC